MCPGVDGSAVRKTCAQFAGQGRRITLREHEHLVGAMHDRTSHDPALMGLRRSTVEPPFGTIKVWMGATHVRTEMCIPRARL